VGEDYQTCYYTNTAQFFSTAADADLNNNGKIDAATNPGDEGYDYKNFFLNPINNATVNATYQFLAKNLSVGAKGIFQNGFPIATVVTNPTPEFTLNDLAVAVPNAQYDGFTPLSDTVSGSTWNGIPIFLANHRTVGCSGGTAGCAAGQNSPPDRPISIVANAVIAAIQNAQTLSTALFQHTNFPCVQ
jgi:hypothetical protein